MSVWKLFDLRQAVNYLHGTIIQYQGEPFYVIEILPTGDSELDYKIHGAVVSKPTPKRPIILDQMDPGLNFEPVKLGMMAYSKEKETYLYPFYCSRLPQRQWKIGLTAATFTIKPLFHGELNGMQYPASYRIGHFLQSQEMYNTVMGLYPDFDAAVKLSKKLTCPIAFSRRFAVGLDSVFYKTIGKAVGKITDRGVELEEDFLYLKEVLAEDMS